MIKSKFPVDIFAVKEYGIERWLDEFFWPVSEEEYVNLYRDIEQYLIRLIDGQAGEIKDLLIIQYKHLKLEYANLLHALKVIQYLRTKKIDIACSDKAWWYKDLIKGGDLRAYVTAIEIKGRGSIVKDRINPFIKSLIYNRNIFKYVTSLGRKEKVKICGSAKPFIAQYITALPDWVYFTTQFDWLPKDRSCEVTYGQRNDIRRVSAFIASGIEGIAAKYGIMVSDSYRSGLGKLTDGVLADAARAFLLVKRALRQNIHLLLPSLESNYNKALSLAVRQRGGRVTSFAHGNVDFLNHPLSILSPFNMPLADDFIAYTSESAKLYERIKIGHPPSRDNRLNIVSGETNEHFKRWKRYRNAPLPGKNRRIMIIGSPHHQARRPLAAGLSQNRLDLELRLVDTLGKAGYEVLYKAHPGRMREIEGIFEGSARVIKGYFEDVLDKADAFLFGTITTTTLASALCTNKPVVTLDLSFKFCSPFPEAVELFKKRCTVVRTEYDRRSRIIFDERGLLDALARKPGYPNTEFVETYLFPQRAKEKYSYEYKS